MNAGELKEARSWVRSRRLWMAGLAAAAVSSMALLLPRSVGDPNQKPAAHQDATTPAAHVPRVFTDAGWDRLSALERQTLEPLRDTWSTLTVEQQDKWRAIAQRVQGRPRHVRRRLAARIAQWASLSPDQRAHARLNFLELAKRYDTRQRREQWRAYQSAKPAEGHAVALGAPERVISPALVQASPGATTVLLSQLYELPSANDTAQRDKTARDPTSIDEHSPNGSGAASASAGSAANLERAAP
jgi:hypothetical protein